MLDELSIDLEGMFGQVALKDWSDSLFENRYDTKYLFSPILLGEMLERSAEDYHILSVDGVLSQDYESIYFDNDRFRFYLDHQNGKLNRYKLRFRKYNGSEDIYFEVKFKNNRYQTRKWRIKLSKTAYDGIILTDVERAFTEKFLGNGYGEMYARLAVKYRRLTLIPKKGNSERITIDLGLSYQRCDETLNFNRVAIAEVKQRSSSRSSSFFSVMRAVRIPPTRFSKYCFGIYNFYPNLKWNRFKPRYLAFEKRSNGLIKPVEK